jgi:hypothetical protein
MSAGHIGGWSRESVATNVQVMLFGCRERFFFSKQSSVVFISGSSDLSSGSRLPEAENKLQGVQN